MNLTKEQQREIIKNRIIKLRERIDEQGDNLKGMGDQLQEIREKMKLELKYLKWFNKLANQLNERLDELEKI